MSDNLDFLDEEQDVKKDLESVIKPTVKSDKIETKEAEEDLTLHGNDYPEEYMTLVEKVLQQYKALPVLDYNKLYHEMASLTIKSTPTPTLQDINRDLQMVQASKERLSEILIAISRSYILKKRVVDILTESWAGKFSQEKSADKRNGDAIFRLSNFDLDFCQVESLQKVAIHIAQNLDSLQESLSRRITIFQMQLKLHDMGRTSLPSYTFDNDPLTSIGDDKSNPLDATSKW